MALINYSARELNCKIVYYGPGLCGKTTNIQYIYSKIAPQYKGKMISLATEKDRTLFFDFLPLDIGKVKGFTTRFQLYTVPGQVFYAASRRLILKGVDGVIFVADSQVERFQDNKQSFKDLAQNLASQGYDIRKIPLILQYNKRDLPNITPVETLEKTLNFRNLQSFEAIATKGVGVFDTLKAITKLVLKELSK